MRVEGRVTEVRERQPSKVFFLMVVMPSGITMEDRERQSSKQDSSIEVRVEGRVTEVREEQPLKQWSLIEVKPSGRLIVAREEQPLKQYCPNKSIVEGRVTEAREEQPLKQLLSQVTPSGITTEVSEEQP